MSGTDGGRDGGEIGGAVWSSVLAEMGLYGPSRGAGEKVSMVNGGGEDGDGVLGTFAMSMTNGGSNTGGESRPGEALAGGVLNSLGILGPGL